MNLPKAKRVKRQFDDTFLHNAAALVESSGRPLSEIATELGVWHWNLRDLAVEFQQVVQVESEA
jgi:hypothetical protein